MPGAGSSALVELHFLRTLSGLFGSVLLEAEEGVAVGTGGLVEHAALEIQEGRGLEEQGGEGAGGGIEDGVALVGAAPEAGQGGGDRIKAVQNRIEEMKVPTEATPYVSTRNPQTSPLLPVLHQQGKKKAKSRNPLLIY